MLWPSAEGVVAAEEFVAAISTEGHSDMTAGEAA